MGSLMFVQEFGKQPVPAAPPVMIGVDIGQKVDPTAIVVAETIKTGDEWAFVARHLERLPLGTDYPAVAARILEVVTNIQLRPVPELRHPAKITIVVDSTGVGAPVVDILRKHLTGSKAVLTEATFTHGDRLTGRTGNRRMSVGKAYLVSRLQALFQTQRVQLPAHHPEAAAMARELQDYEIRIDDNANDRYGAFRVGSHDDLVTALGLAVLCDPYQGAKVRSF